ncbi:helix-turn-helix domain-containing protein [Jiella mangrovi]|uniref:Helix-turn-helix transcriptional regulator n=1 Tax=Jiella mangrovi TaxID=2821407 RepID=A0ABS4BIU9_9HYPH|nr:AraC family transcriptional regulator [Jiella mangrovi]MBP0616462.1 helix-turn-helix transcriptional regulator [Jiella mangrovi]
MSFKHSMVSRTEGIRATEPVKWRSLDGCAGVYWVAEGQPRARGYYVSPDPRIVVFFNEVSAQIRMCDREDDLPQRYRPMQRAIYVPAGMPLWTDFAAMHRFSHLDLHVHRDRMLRFLAPSLGHSAAKAALRRPAEIADIGPIETLAGLIVAELSVPSRHAVYCESLVGSLAAALLDIPAGGDDTARGGALTPNQMNTLTARLDETSARRLTVAEMAAAVGLSETRFAASFKHTTGQTPLQWQLAQRIARAKDLLLTSDLTVAGVASQLGFADQAHLTRTFRQIAGETPAAWCEINRALRRKR